MDQPAPSPLIRSFERHLRSENRSERTIATYLIALRQADAFLHARDTTLEAATRADLEAFLGDLLARRAPSTAATYYKVLKTLYAWLTEEAEIPSSPMRMKPPIVPDKPVPIVPDEGLKRLFKACAGNTFEARRDAALLMLLLDTGARRDELAGLKLSDIDLALDVVLVLGKGRRERTLPLVAGLVRRWIATCVPASATRTQPVVAVAWQEGPADRVGPGDDAAPPRRPSGSPWMHPHQFRHTFAHQWLAEGGGETDLVRLPAGGPAPCFSAMAPRPPTPAREAHRRLSPGDRL